MTRVLVFVLVALAGAGQMAIANAGSVPYGSTCGVERWPIKTLMDAGARSLPASPTDTTIAHLVALKAPADPDAIAGRISGVENVLWRVHARLVGYRIEEDSDYHLVLRDPQTGQAMVAEIPAPYCTSSAKGSAFATARRGVDQIGHHPATRRWWWLDWHGATPPMVILTGYGFFDVLHDVTGRAPNGAEIHPVISVQIAK